MTICSFSGGVLFWIVNYSNTCLYMILYEYSKDSISHHMNPYGKNVCFLIPDIDYSIQYLSPNTENPAIKSTVM